MEYSFEVAYARCRQVKEGNTMPEENTATTPVFEPQDHPWLEMPAEEDSLDETIRFSLDEIRIA